MEMEAGERRQASGGRQAGGEGKSSIGHATDDGQAIHNHPSFFQGFPTLFPTKSNDEAANSHHHHHHGRR